MSLKISFIKKNFICKEKYGTVTNVKLVTRIKKLRKLSFILELWYYYRIVIVEMTHKITTFFKILASKKAVTWRLKKSQIIVNFS